MEGAGLSHGASPGSREGVDAERHTVGGWLLVWVIGLAVAVMLLGGHVTRGPVRNEIPSVQMSTIGTSAVTLPAGSSPTGEGTTKSGPAEVSPGGPLTSYQRR